MFGERVCTCEHLFCARKTCRNVLATVAGSGTVICPQANTFWNWPRPEPNHDGGAILGGAARGAGTRAMVGAQEALRRIGQTHVDLPEIAETRLAADVVIETAAVLGCRNYHARGLDHNVKLLVRPIIIRLTQSVSHTVCELRSG